MFPEQSQTRKNQEKSSALGAFLMIIASIIALLMPLMIQSMLEDPENVKWWEPSGKVILLYIPIIGTVFAIFGLVGIILAFFSVDEIFIIILKYPSNLDDVYEFYETHKIIDWNCEVNFDSIEEFYMGN